MTQANRASAKRIEQDGAEFWLARFYIISGKANPLLAIKATEMVRLQSFG